MLNFNSVLVFSENPKALAEFYTKVFGKEKPDMEMEGYYGINAGNTFFSFGAHDKVHGKNATPERMMLNFETKDVKGEFDRIKALGATVIAEPYQMGEGDTTTWIATFADIDGNYFQLLPPWNEDDKK